MADWLRRHIWQIGLGLLALVALVVGLLTIRFSPLEANAGMPADQRAYWSWIGSINQGAETALDSGLELLAAHPHLHALYLRLAEVCRQAEAQEACRAALGRTQPPDSLVRLYREAALTLLLPDTPAEAQAQWQRLARAPTLDPTLARLVVDRVARTGQDALLASVEDAWRQGLEADSTAVGAAFGLGYAAVRRSEWAVAEPLLARVARLAPDDPQPYRELGRIYYNTSQPDKFDQALAAGIEAAERRFDLEQALILRGNLSLGLLQRSGDLEKAEKITQEALAQSRTLADGETEGFNLYRLASIYFKQNRYDEVFSLLDSADVRYARYAPRQHPEVVALRGATLSSMYRFSDAEATLEAAIAEAEERRNVGIKVQALVSLTQLRYRMGRYSAAREAGLEALALAQQYRLRDHEIAARIGLAEAERRWGNLEAATAHLQAGLHQAEETRNEARLRELHSRLGRVALDAQDANAAREHFEKMFEEGVSVERSADRARAYLGLGHAYYQFQNFPEALRYYDLAQAHLPDQGEARLHVNVLVARAWAYNYLAAYEEARAVLEEARRHVANNPAALYRIHEAYGELYLNQGLFREALAQYQEAEKIERRYDRPAFHWNVLFGKALAHWQLQELKSAESAFREAIDIIEALRENFNSSVNRAYFVRNKAQVYEHFAAFLEAQGRSEEALYYTERARSRSLVDLLYTTQQERRLDAGRSTDRMIEMDRRVRALAREISIDGLDLDPEDASAYHATRVRQLRREYQRADSIYRQARLHLSSQDRMYTFAPLAPDSLRHLLREGEAMVVYDLRTIGLRKPQQDVSVAYVVLPDTVVLRRLALQGAVLAEQVRFFRDQLGGSEGGPGTGWEPAARRLYRELIAPVLPALPDSVRHLHLLPEGVLHYLPFAALLDEAGRFLVERYTLSITPSASVLGLSRQRNPRRWRSMLLLADPQQRLPGSRQEVLAIQAESPNRRLALVGDKATQANLEELADGYDVLHFATHGRFVSQAPWRSYLELYDDVLSVEEIGQLALDAYLVTLSACETALSGGLLSDVPDGDEWVGLNQAFLAAGTPTVMASLWPIDDRVSSTLMIAFYEGLGPAGKAHALAQVQRRFIRDPRTRHPFYWAPFTITGDPL